MGSTKVRNLPAKSFVRIPLSLHHGNVGRGLTQSRDGAQVIAANRLSRDGGLWRPRSPDRDVRSAQWDPAASSLVGGRHMVPKDVPDAGASATYTHAGALEPQLATAKAIGFAIDWRFSADDARPMRVIRHRLL